MKTLIIPVGFFGDEHMLVAPDRLTKYPAANQHTLEVKHERLTSGDVLKADAALNRRRDLFQEGFDGSLKAGVGEGFSVARAVEIVSRTVKGMVYKDQNGNAVETVTDFTVDGIDGQPHQIVLEIASRIEFPRLPTIEEISKAGED